MKRKSDKRRQQKHHVDGISEPLLVFGIVRPRGIERAPVISLLDFDGNVIAVRIAVVKQQFPRPQPARIQVRQIAARTLARCSIRNLKAHEDSIHIKPHARCGDESKNRADLNLPRQGR